MFSVLTVHTLIYDVVSPFLCQYLYLSVSFVLFTINLSFTVSQTYFMALQSIRISMFHQQHSLKEFLSLINTQTRLNVHPFSEASEKINLFKCNTLVTDDF